VGLRPGVLEPASGKHAIAQSFAEDAYCFTLARKVRQADTAPTRNTLDVASLFIIKRNAFAAAHLLPLICAYLALASTYSVKLQSTSLAC
jgi:hypothetical protein